MLLVGIRGGPGSEPGGVRAGFSPLRVGEGVGMDGYPCDRPRVGVGVGVGMSPAHLWDLFPFVCHGAGTPCRLRMRICRVRLNNEIMEAGCFRNVRRGEGRTRERPGKKGGGARKGEEVKRERKR